MKNGRGKNRTVYLLVFFAVFLCGCGKQKNPAPRVIKKVAHKPKPKPAPPKPKLPGEEVARKYIYRGDEYRDPFGAVVIASSLSGKLMEGEEIQVNIDALRVTGIMTSAQQKPYALLSEIGGASFIVKGGKLYDPYGRIVRDVAAIIKEDRVVLIAGKNTMRELKLEE